MNLVIVRTLVLPLLLTGLLRAQVPQLVNYQGRVAVDGVNFEGPGHFKFALVSAEGTTSYWSNDGTSVAGREPVAAVTLPVARGLYSVLLGDSTLANMTGISATVLNDPGAQLRVWFNDGSHGFQLLTPDQSIPAVGYAIVAGNVADGAITSAKIASGAVDSTHLAPGAVVANLEASGQGAVANGGLVLSATENAALVGAGYVKLPATLTTDDEWRRYSDLGAPVARASHTAVWTGSEMIVWGGRTTSNAVVWNDGARFNPVSNTWTQLNPVGAPAARTDHTAVWTGSEMIVWGGIGSATWNDGSRYNPASDSWIFVTTTNAPSPRYGHTAVWTGNVMVVWGGFGDVYLDDGGRYDPITNSWTAVIRTGAPPPRASHTAVWTGIEMIIWGGGRGSTSMDTGGRFNPVTNHWMAVAATGAPSPRSEHSAVWTGTEMIVWGGRFLDNGTLLNDGRRYSAARDGWLRMSMSAVPTPRSSQRSIWTGSQMIVWGGYGGATGSSVNTGGAYDPAGDSWRAVTAAGAPAGRFGHSAVWTGTEMLIWGGGGVSSSLAGTFSYNPRGTLYLYQRP